VSTQPALDPAIQLPASDDLVRAFLADLSKTVENLLKVLIGGGSSSVGITQNTGQNTGSVILFNSTSGTAVSWRATRDLILIGGHFIAGSSQCCVSLDGTDYNSAFAVGGLGLQNVLMMPISNTSDVWHSFHVPIKHNDKVYLQSRSASNAAVILYFV
jgi:hypothetical protein